MSVAWSPDVTRLVVERGVVIEACPTSNARTRAVPSIEEHPARRLLHEGALVTINTDDPGLFGIDLTHELEVCQRDLGFDEADLRTVTKNAIAASFLPDSVKASVRQKHFGWLSAG